MRIDKYLAEKYGSRTKAAQAVERGLVLVNGKTVAVSYEVRGSDTITFAEEGLKFVSLGGYKLEKALNDFNFNVTDRIFADIGASTGGFTDCLLQRGAKKVYCIDVGESQLDERLKSSKVVIIDNFNARNLHSELFEEEIDGVVIDVSFISLTYVLDKVATVLSSGKSVLALIKPQFECESRSVGKNGIVKEPKIHRRIILKICEFAKGCGLSPQRLTTAPINKGKNIEYVILLEKGAKSVDFEQLIKSVKL